jgi:hypothetical protein
MNQRIPEFLADDWASVLDVANEYSDQFCYDELINLAIDELGLHRLMN